MAVDVTARFYVLRGQRPPSIHEAIHGPLWELYRSSSSVWDQIKSKQSIDSQEDIEEIEDEWKTREGELNESEREIGKTIVSILFEELRDLLTKHQQKAIAQLQREINMKKYFEPDLGRLVVQAQRAALKNSPKIVFSKSSVEPTPELEREAEILLATYQSDQDQVFEVRKKIQETSALLSVLSSKAVEQQEIAASIFDVATESVGHVDSAEDQLKKAIKNNDSFKVYLVVYLWILTGIMWFLHLVKS
jgi:hypothetical protein